MAQIKLMPTCLGFVFFPAAHGPATFSQSWILIGHNTAEEQTGYSSTKLLLACLTLLTLKICKLNSSYLDSRSNLRYVISDVFFSSSFKWDFCAHDAYKDTNLVLYLVNLVIIPAEKVFSKVSLIITVL